MFILFDLISPYFFVFESAKPLTILAQTPHAQHHHTQSQTVLHSNLSSTNPRELGIVGSYQTGRRRRSDGNDIGIETRGVRCNG